MTLSPLEKKILLAIKVLLLVIVVWNVLLYAYVVSSARMKEPDNWGEVRDARALEQYRRAQEERATQVRRQGRIDSQSSQDEWTYCRYSDGRIVTIPIGDRCPRVIQ